MAPHRDATEILADIASILGIPAEEIGAHARAAAAVRVVREMHEDGADRSDPVRTILTRVGDRWTPFLVQLLEPGPLRFALLRRMVITILGEDISKQILSGKLHALERDGFVHRVDLGGARPAVEYSLTPLGLQFADQIKRLITWSRATIPAVRAARAVYDAKSHR
jgi:DNA-binding HxlR family transcriptional regulator